MHAHFDHAAHVVVTPRPAGHRHTRTRGFTLIEAMIVLAVVAILASVALPTFGEALHKGRRIDAYAALVQAQLAQERRHASHGSYAASLTAASNATPAGLGLSGTSGGGHYELAITETSAVGYSIVATAIAGGGQARDRGCQRLRLRVDRGQVYYGAAATDGDFDETNARRCWLR